MFDIGFSEIAVVGVVALVVLGPERLPKVARTAGHMFGRLQRYVATVKSDINREMDASELSKLKEEVTSAARSFEQTMQEAEEKTAKVEARTRRAEAKAAKYKQEIENKDKALEDKDKALKDKDKELAALKALLAEIKQKE